MQNLLRSYYVIFSLVPLSAVKIRNMKSQAIFLMRKLVRWSTCPHNFCVLPRCSRVHGLPCTSHWTMWGFGMCVPRILIHGTSGRRPTWRSSTQNVLTKPSCLCQIMSSIAVSSSICKSTSSPSSKFLRLSYTPWRLTFASHFKSFRPQTHKHSSASSVTNGGKLLAWVLLLASLAMVPWYGWIRQKNATVVLMFFTPIGTWFDLSRAFLVEDQRFADLFFSIEHLSLSLSFPCLSSMLANLSSMTVWLWFFDQHITEVIELVGFPYDDVLLFGAWKRWC